MDAKRRIVFLHGLGQGPDSWQPVACQLAGADAVIPDLGAMLAGRAEVDIPALLPRVRCRTLVLCGEKDRANRKAARQLQEGLSNAAMQIIDGAGHEANREAPEALSAALAAFYGAE